MAQLLLRGIELGEVEAVLFDKDGTLSISEPQLVTLAQARVFLCLDQVFAQADAADARRAAGAAAGATSRTTEGLHDWLGRLQAAGVRCAVISNDDVAGIETFLSAHGLSAFFGAIWSAEHSPRKPDPAAGHALCALLGVSAARCALIGDANSDLRMAVAAGIPHQRALGYTAAWSAPPPLAEPHPRVHHWDELVLA